LNVPGRREGALVVLSGGQDSTTVLFWARNRYQQVQAVTFTYGQVHAREVECARTVARRAGVVHHVLPLDVFEKLGAGSLVKGGRPAARDGLPDTFVPGRNIIFFSCAAALAYTLGIRDVVVGVSQVDYAGYPDCREETVKALERALRLGLDYPLHLVAPLVRLSKAEVVKLARREGCFDMLAYTHTCYRGLHPPCGTCNACRLREKGFREAGYRDPLLG